MKEATEEYEAYPLAWPNGFRRHTSRIDSRFHRRVDHGNKEITLRQARDALRSEVESLGGKDLVISTNMKTRKGDGDVYSDAREPDDPGVAIYFKFKGGSRCLCADQYRTVRENTYALAKTIEAMRGIDRWGASEMLDRMFTGFKMLPSPAQVRWWEILGVGRGEPIETIRSAYRKKLMESHPDRTGQEGTLDGIIIETAWSHAKAEKGVG